ncbi:hypothetical protein CKO51_16780 [Rhodopirellula sp. SM50]|nr:hypothetical protein CKO51_16780 [Rhodopirellula sp. SM50]
MEKGFHGLERVIQDQQTPSRPAYVPPDNLFIGAAVPAFDNVLRKSAHAGHADSSRLPGWNEIPNAMGVRRPRGTLELRPIETMPAM